MELSKSKITEFNCPSCDGDARWILSGTVRNFIAGIIHLLSALGWLFIIIIFDSGSIVFFLAAFAGWVLVSYIIRRLYKTTLRCEVCGEIIENRDIFDGTNYK